MLGATADRIRDLVKDLTHQEYETIQDYRYLPPESTSQHDTRTSAIKLDVEWGVLELCAQLRLVLEGTTPHRCERALRQSTIH
jgi:hypothetical protein